MRSMWRARQWGMGVLLLAMATAGWAEGPAPNPADLVRRAVANEAKANSDRSKYMFKDRKQTPRGCSTKLIVETNEATAGLVIAYDDKPLGPEQQRAEMARVRRFLDDPEELRKKAKQEKEDAERVNRIVRALPDAFLYQADGTERGSEGVGKAGDELVRLSFKPNPAYSPPSRVEQVLTGMQGYLLIDAEQMRIAKMDGTLFKDVGFGWGILGHLDKGGHFLVEQAEVEKRHWDISRMSLKFTGRILLFKRIDIESEDRYSDFREVAPDLTFAQAVELLKKQQAELAASHGTGSGLSRR